MDRRLIVAVSLAIILISSWHPLGRATTSEHTPFWMHTFPKNEGVDEVSSPNKLVLAYSDSGIDNIEHISYSASNGTYYLFVEITELNHNPQDFLLLSDLPLTLIEIIPALEIYEVLLTVSIIGIIIVAAIYIVMWYRERHRPPEAEDLPPIEGSDLAEFTNYFHIMR